MKSLFLVQGRAKFSDRQGWQMGMSVGYLSLPFSLFFLTVFYTLIYATFTPFRPLVEIYGILSAYFLMSILYVENVIVAEKKSDLLSGFFVLANAAFILTLWSYYQSFSSLFVVLLCLNIIFSGVLVRSQFVFYSAILTAIAYNCSFYFGLMGGRPNVMLFVLNHISFYLVAFTSFKLIDSFSDLRFEVTEKKKKIKSLSHFNNLLIEKMSSAVVVTDDNMEIRFSNTRIESIFSEKSETVMGHSLFEYFLKSDVSSWTSELKEQDHYHVEYKDKKQDKIFDITISPFKGYEDWAGYILLIKDVTQVYQLKENMKQKEKLAAVGQLAAGIAHEIRNPLASMSGSVQLLKSMGDGQRDAEEVKLLSIVQKEAERLNGLITEFLDYVRPAEKFTDLVSLNDVLQGTLEFVKLNNKLVAGVEQKSQLASQSLIYGNSDKLRQAFLNIIINAYHAMEEQKIKEIKVSTFDSEGSVWVKIVDSGKGIPEDNIKRIFEPFHTTKHNGTGLGLAVTHKIIESHEGEVTVMSEEGVGTEFILKFPVSHEPEPLSKALNS